jgi:hypothetical protein
MRVRASAMSRSRLSTVSAVTPGMSALFGAMICFSRS